MSMKLPRAGKEYAHYTVASPDTLTGFEVQLIDGGPWVPATYALGVVSLLVCGPDCPTPAGAVVVAASCQPSVRCTDNPEIVIRQDGWIMLV